MKEVLMNVVFFFRRRICFKKWSRLEQLLRCYCFDTPYDKKEFTSLKEYFGIK